MEAYADYNFYKENFKGAIIPDSSFDNLSLQASYYIDSITLGRIGAIVNDNVKMATCAAAEALFKYRLNEGKSSESVGKVSITYSNKSTEAKKMNAAVLPYLMNTGLMSRIIPSRG